MIDTIRIAETDSEIAGCFAVMRELRPHLADSESFVIRVREQQRHGGYRLAYRSAESGVAAVAGFRILENLASGRILYVDDLVTLAAARSRGHGAAMLRWLEAYAADDGCVSLQLDSGMHRVDAHRFYDREGYARIALHFAKCLETNRAD